MKRLEEEAREDLAILGYGPDSMTITKAAVGQRRHTPALVTFFYNVETRLKRDEARGWSI